MALFSTGVVIQFETLLKAMAEKKIMMLVKFRQILFRSHICNWKFGHGLRNLSNDEKYFKILFFMLILLNSLLSIIVL